MKMDGAQRLISICDDESLRYSREMILRYAGNEVLSFSSNASMEELTSARFDIAILCQSIHPERAVRIVQTLKRSNPEIRILRINPYPNRPRSSGDAEYEVPARPTALLRAVAALRGEVRRSA